MLAFNEDIGGHIDPVPVAEPQCQHPILRSWEQGLRLRIFEFESIHDDHPVTNAFNVGWVIRLGDRGLKPRSIRDEATGFVSWEPPIKEFADLRKLRFRSIEIDRERTARHVEMAQAILGDILRVHITCGPMWHGKDYAILGMQWWNSGITSELIRLRGHTQVMLDMYDNPNLLHDLASLLRDDTLQVLETYEREGLLTLNNNPDDYIGSGALGATAELPADSFQGRVRLKELWGLAESQDFSDVGPDQWYEFSLQYQLPIINRFGLACYGCCEPLDWKYDLLFEHIPRLRRVSVTPPYADTRKAAEKLGSRYILSWKPPSPWLYGDVDWGFIEQKTRETIRIAREHGSCLEIVMKGFKTDYQRIGRWAEITSRLVKEMA